MIGNKNDLDKYGVEIISSNAKPYSPAEQLDLPLKIPQTDLFWTPHFNAPFMPVKAGKRAVTIHDVFHLTRSAPYGVVKRMYARSLYANAVKKSDIIFTISEFTKSEILRSFPFIEKHQDKIKVIYRYPDQMFDRIEESDKKAKTFLKKAGIPENYILYVGNIKPHKNIEGLLRAFSLASGKVPGYNLVCVGQKDKFLTGFNQREDLIESLLIKKKVFFTGIINDEELVQLYNHARLLILPSFYEGFGLPPLEAMACGCPVIVSDIPPLKEVCGEAAFFITPSSVESIMNGLIIMIKDEKLRSKLIEKGYKQAARFKKEKIEAAYSRELKKVLAG